MSRLKFSIALASGLLLVGLGASAARSDDAPPSRGSGDNWDGRPGVAQLAQVRPGDEGGPPGPRETRGDGPEGQPPPDGDNSRRPPRLRPEDRDRPPRSDGPGGPVGRGPGGPGEMGPPPDGPEGDRRMPMGRPPGLPPRDRDEYESLRTRDPELYKAMQLDRDLERQTRDQADEYRGASKADQAKIKEKLVETVNKHFEVRQQLRNLEVKRLEQQLKQLREKIDQREKSRKDIVEKRVIELTGADEGEHF